MSEAETDETGDFLLESALLEGPLFIGDIKLRPFSIGSLLVARRIRLHIVLTGGQVEGLSVDRIERELETYVWLHHAPIDIICQSVRRGTWPLMAAGYLEIIQLDLNWQENLDSCVSILSMLQEQMAMIMASRFRLGGAKRKQKLFHPNQMQMLLYRISLRREMSERWAMWHLPYVRALGYEHCYFRENGEKTLKPVDQTSADTEDQLKRAEEAAAKQAEVTAEDDW